MSKFRIKLIISDNIVDLSKYHIDNILKVSILNICGVADNYGEKYMYNLSTKILQILGIIVKKDIEIVIDFYSKVENRDKLLNEILN